MAIEWTESQRIEMCAHIVPLIQSGLPIDRGLKSIAGELPKRLASISSSIQAGLTDGQSLSNVLASGNRPESRSLSAAIVAGEISGDMAGLLESWASLHTSLALAKKQFRYRLVYPICLILITVFAIGFSMHSLVPQYRANLLGIHASVPTWFEWIEFVHRHVIAWGIVAVILSVSPIVYLAWRRGTFDKNGWPRDLAYGLRLQSHASMIAARLIHAQIPLETAKELTVGSLGIVAGSTNRLDPACESVFQLLGKGVLAPAKAVEMHQDISRYLRDRSDSQIESQGKWIAYSVSISVAIVVGLSYLLVIYLPWVYLLDQLEHIRAIR